MIKIFPYARLALSHALSKFNLRQGDIILVPDFNCSVIYQPILDLGIILKFYPIFNSFEPDWEKIQTLLCNETKAIMMVHYFGQPQKIEDFIFFCKENNLLLIEDNAHGHSGTYKNIPLGKFGDIGFSSPRKQLNLEYGAILYLKGNDKNINNSYYDTFITLKTIKLIILKLATNFFWLKLFLKKMFLKKPNFSNFLEFKEVDIKSSKIDLYSLQKFHKANWSEIGECRRHNWIEWVKFCKVYNLNPVWDKPNQSSCPWLLPVYVENIEFRRNVLDASWDSGLGFITWPSLPDFNLNSTDPELVLNRWQKLICIPLYKSPSELKNEINNFNMLISLNIKK